MRMTLTQDRRAVFARQAIARFDAGERKLLPAVQTAIGEYLAVLRRAWGEHAAGILTADASTDSARPFTDADADALLDVLDQADVFGDILDSTVMPALRAQLVPILQAGMTSPTVSDDLIQWRNAWLADRRQSLLGVPDSITDQLRTALRGAASAVGTSVDDAEALAQDMLDAGYPSWLSRAEMIARTETVGANNQGSLAAVSAIADQEGMQATKTWLATEDARTREAHSEVDGTTVGLSELFDVGEDRMTGPGDPSADAGNVINCRCTLIYDFPNGASASADDSGDLGDALDGNTDDTGSTDGLGDGSGDGTLTAAAAPPSGVAIMLGLGPADSATITSAPGVPAPDPPGPHCTVAYLADPADSYTPEQRTALLTALAELDPAGAAEAFGTALLNQDSDERDPCAVLLVQSDWLATFRDSVLAAVEQAGASVSETFPVWLAHVAVGYNIDVDAIPAAVIGQEIGFDRLIVGWGGEQIVAAGVGAVDPSGDNAGEMTAATEAAVTAPADTAAPPAETAPAAPTPGELDPAVLAPMGQTWQGPLGFLDQFSSDGRVVRAGGGSIRPLPQALSWQESNEPGHDGAVLIGRILGAEVRGNMVWGHGDYLDPGVNYNVLRAISQVDAGLGYVSLDLACTEVGYCDNDGNMIDPMLWSGDYDDIHEVALTWEIGGATVLTFPAFAEARIINDPAPVEEGEMSSIPVTAEPVVGPALGATQFAVATPEAPTVADDAKSITMQDGSTVEVGANVAWMTDGETTVGVLTAINVDDETVTVQPPTDDSGEQPPTMTIDLAQLVPMPEDAGKPGMAGESELIASAVVKPYTAAFFKPRELSKLTPVTIDRETGEVYGHLDQWGQCHLGKLAETGRCVTPPPEPGADFSFFHLTPLPTDEGIVYVGRLTVGTGHAGPGGFRGAAEHYDHSGTQAALVRAYEDEFGQYVTGQLINGVDPLTVDELSISPLSGDWRRTEPGGPLRLVAALGVNVPAFPIVPTIGLDADGEQISLVAAGVVRWPEAIERGTDLVLPSGRTIDRDDFEALTAATIETLARRERLSREDEDALALTRARVALAGRRRLAS